MSGKGGKEGEGGSEGGREGGREGERGRGVSLAANFFMAFTTKVF